MFRAIFASQKSKTNSSYIATTMLISNIKKVGLNIEDVVIVAVDSPKGSWRRDIDSNYKSDRKAKRAKYDINWEKEFNQFNKLLEQLADSTPFYVIGINRMEADDIIAYACKKFSSFIDCVIISSDTDFEQLCAYENVRIFSPISKKYKIVNNPHEILAKKIKKEVADNLITDIKDEADFVRREKIVNIIDLPKDVESKIENYIDFLPVKIWDFNNTPFESLRERFKGIYLKDKVVNIIQKPKKRRKKC